MTVNRGLDPGYGVNVVGYLEAELGLGEVARKLVSAAERAGVPTATITYRRTRSRQGHRFQERAGEARYSTNIICVNAAQLPELRKDLGPDLFAARYSIGVWFWELSVFPSSMHRAFDLVDEVWVASEFTREAVAAETSKPVHVVPVPLEPPEVSPVSRAEVGLPDGFLFLFSFDFLSIAERKYPLGLVEAFCRAFRPGEGPMLAIKSINGDRRSEELTRLRRAAAGRPDVHVLDGYVPPATKDAVMASCDCYVSLHRSEGLGLTLAEAMALGKPVIATGYSGNLAFMDEENSYLVRHGTAITPAGIDPYPAGAEWAEPDLDHAAELMRRVYEHPEEARERGARARRDLLASHSVAQAAAFIRRRLDEIPMHGNLLRDVRGPLERAAALVSQQAGDSLVRAPRRWSPAGLVRPLLRRALWPELAEQKQLDAALVEALRGLERVNRSEFARRLDELERAGRREGSSGA